ncbi:MAG: type IV pilus assembly protein PilM [Bacillota bacterium]
MSRVERNRVSTGRDLLPAGADVGFRWGFLSPQGKTGVGVDMGSGHLKVVQTRWTRNGPRLENYAICPLPSGMMLEGAVVTPEHLGDLLRNVVRAMGLRQSRLGCSIGGPAVMMRYLNLPRVSMEEMRAAMKFEAPQHLPIPEEQLVYDFCLVADAPGVPEHQVAVFLAGTQKRLVQGHLDSLARAGLRSDAVELDCMALIRALEWMGAVPHESAHPVVLLDFGEVGTRIAIMRFGIPMLSRTIPTGLTHLRTAIADTLGMPLYDAERAMRLKGVEEDPELAPAVGPWLDTLVEAIGRSVEFFLIQHRGVHLERVFLSGGGAMLPGMSRTLTDRLAPALGLRADGEPVAVEEATLHGIEINPALLPQINNVGPILLTALGSALREG